MATRKTQSTKPPEPSSVRAAAERGVYVPPELDPSYVQALTEGGYGAGPHMLRSAVNRSLGLTEGGEAVDPRLAAGAGVGPRFTETAALGGPSGRAMPTERISNRPGGLYAGIVGRQQESDVLEAKRGAELGRAAGGVTPREEMESERAIAELQAAAGERAEATKAIGAIGARGFPEDIPRGLFGRAGIEPPAVGGAGGGEDFAPGETFTHEETGEEYTFEGWIDERTGDARVRDSRGNVGRMRLR